MDSRPDLACLDVCQSTTFRLECRGLFHRASAGAFAHRGLSEKAAFHSLPVVCHIRVMAIRASRGGKRADPIQNALRVVEESTGEILKPAEGKNVHAQALSALGASKGGKARAESLTAKRRTAIAKKAAKSRWGKQRKT